MSGTLPPNYLDARVVEQLKRNAICKHSFFANGVCKIQGRYLNDKDETQDCSICLQPLDTNDPGLEFQEHFPELNRSLMIVKGCGHCYHGNCGMKHFNSLPRCPDCGVHQYDTNNEMANRRSFMRDLDWMSLGHFDRNRSKISLPKVKVVINSAPFMESVLIAAYFLLRTRYGVEDPKYFPLGVAAHPDGRVIVQRLHDHGLAMHGSQKFLDVLRDHIPSRICSRAQRDKKIVGASKTIHSFTDRLCGLAIHRYGALCGQGLVPGTASHSH